MTADREQVRRDAGVPSRDECLAWMEKYASTPFNMLALATSSAHDPSALKVMAGLRVALEQAEQHEAKWKRTEGWLNDKLTAAEARLASVPALVEARDAEQARAKWLQKVVNEGERTEGELKRREAALVEALRRISERQPAVVETLRANGIVFTTALGKPDDERTDAERWEKVAFSIYTDICEVDTQARAALTVYEQSQGGKG